ncbi:MAG: hypothetical protein NC548_23000 [Lachnospiraceae bacterium]|nr:hypothetical protein [Lachnospiraceae bacterium]
MINAKEAYEQTSAADGDLDDEILKECEQEINRAVAMGHYDCFINEYLRRPVRYKLEKLGYQVFDYSSQRDGNCFKITWGYWGGLSN